MYYVNKIHQVDRLTVPKTNDELHLIIVALFFNIKKKN